MYVIYGEINGINFSAEYAHFDMSLQWCSRPTYLKASYQKEQDIIAITGQGIKAVHKGNIFRNFK